MSICPTSPYFLPIFKSSDWMEQLENGNIILGCVPFPYIQYRWMEKKNIKTSKKWTYFFLNLLPPTPLSPPTNTCTSNLTSNGTWCYHFPNKLGQFLPFPIAKLGFSFLVYAVLRMNILFVVQTRTHLKVKADAIINFSRTINMGKPGLFLEDECMVTLGSHFLPICFPVSKPYPSSPFIC